LSGLVALIQLFSFALQSKNIHCSAMDIKSILSNGEGQRDVESTKNAALVEDHNRYTLHVSNFSFRPRRHVVGHAVLYLRHKISEFNVGWLLPSLKTMKIHDELVLHRINFACRGGELTTVIGDEEETRKLMHLIAGRTKTGDFDGDILLSGPRIDKTTYYQDQVAFVPSVSFITEFLFSSFSYRAFPFRNHYIFLVCHI
jgi:ABC-type uncharacterized transport system ATPase subunit